jgi:hypothetical protein
MLVAVGVAEGKHRRRGPSHAHDLGVGVNCLGIAQT